MTTMVHYNSPSAVAAMVPKNKMFAPAKNKPSASDLQLTKTATQSSTTSSSSRLSSASTSSASKKTGVQRFFDGLASHTSAARIQKLLLLATVIAAAATQLLLLHLDRKGAGSAFFVHAWPWPIAGPDPDALNSNPNRPAAPLPDGTAAGPTSTRGARIIWIDTIGGSPPNGPAPTGPLPPPPASSGGAAAVGSRGRGITGGVARGVAPANKGGAPKAGKVAAAKSLPRPRVKAKAAKGSSGRKK
ncbi:hypothetical protein DFJ73DRAFT_792307 [Zopfochytrium polystomum]|nr:hypothetical protein DFJ73DRAFT_792307 [Zopfochytrium polystomum]